MYVVKIVNEEKSLYGYTEPSLVGVYDTTLSICIYSEYFHVEKQEYRIVVLVSVQPGDLNKNRFLIKTIHLN